MTLSMSQPIQRAHCNGQPDVKAPQHVTAERLLLRRPTQSDASLIFARYASDPAVTRYLSWPRHQSIEQTYEFLSFSDSEWEAWPAGPYLIESRHSGLLLGSTGFKFSGPGEAETGYVLAGDAWHQGYATEALLALMTLCEPLGIRLAWAWCHHEHVASQRVLEKCDFQREQAPMHLLEFPNLGSSARQPVFKYARAF